MKDETSSNLRRWGIAVVCSFINFIHLGVARMSGLLYLSALSRYKSSRSQAAFPFFLCYTIRNVSGPAIGYLGKKVEVRYVIMAGCLLGSLGAGACFFAEDITTVTVLWGIVFGLGFGMATMLLPEVLNQNFDEYITIANGISFGGECVAGFLLPILIKHLLNEYGASGLFLILSSLMLHSLPAAMLLRSPVAGRKRSSRRKLKDSVINNGKTFVAFQEEDTKRVKARLTLDATLDLSQDHKNATSSTKIGDSQLRPEMSNKYEKSLQKYSVIPKNDSFHNSLRTSKDSWRNNFVHDLEDGIACFEHASSSQMHETLLKGAIPDDSSESTASMQSFFGSFKVFLDPPFILILIMQSSVIYTATMILTIIVDLDSESGAEDNGVYILMSFSTADMIGRFGLGWITDGGYMSSNKFFSFCYFWMGVVFVALTILKGFIVVLCAAFVAGLCLGGQLIVGPGIVSDYIERDLVTMALASRFVLYAPMSLTQSTLIGFFRGNFGSYDWVLCILSLICFLSATLSLMLPLAVRCRRARKVTSKEIMEDG